MGDRPRIAAFRPPDERADRAAETIEAAGGDPLVDPMIVPETTGATPRDDADVVVFTSVTAADLESVISWDPAGVTIAAIGPRTAEALEAIGIDVDIVPETYTSDGMVEALAPTVDGARVELARSDHGSAALPDGLHVAGAYVHETVLYRLVRPPEAGASLDAVLAGTVDALAFTSSLTVEHFLELAEERGVRGGLDEALETVCIGAIGPPTAATAAAAGLAVDVVAETATFDALVDGLMAALDDETRSA